MEAISKYIVTSYANLSPMEILQATPDILLGVSPDAVKELKTLCIETVFDLASSRIFVNAKMLFDASTDPRTVLARYGVPPADVIDLLPIGVSIDQLCFQDISLLEGIGATNAPGVSTALNVKTVRDLALWPPYLAAQDIYRSIFFSETVPGNDPEAPADLLPRSGDYPTERVFYSTLVFDGFDLEVGESLPLDKLKLPGKLPQRDKLKSLEQGAVIDLTTVVDTDFGFKQLGVGALLTFEQSWYSQGVALGQLLHSVALAPGESTRIAMIDWSRRTSGRQAEDVTETEQLTNVTEHSRALSEVTSAVAREAQSGFSQSNLYSTSSQGGSGSGFSLGPITIGGSSGGAESTSNAYSFSSSFGQRDLAASLSQNVVDRTQQHANAARNRRATVVKEVSQSEHESVSTRVVTNYNHMHALSIQYYEVVQIYRVSVALQRVDRCLFLPMRLLNFRNPELVRKFRKALAAAAVDDDARTLLTTDFDTVVVKSPKKDNLALKNPFGVNIEIRDNGKTLALPDEARLIEIYVMRKTTYVKPKLSDLKIQLRDGTSAEIEYTSSSTTDADTIKVISRPALREIASISMTSQASSGEEYTSNFSFSYHGTGFSFDASPHVEPGGSVTVLTFTGGGIWDRLIEHLETDRLHYSQAIFRSLDPATVTLLLSGFSYRGRPITAQVDPQPLTTAGNYLVFKTHLYADSNAENEEERAWAQWLEDHGVSLGSTKEDLVPLPSGGVFAEGVLGRYNSAEKLDITRFWNWQDSPIPISAPEIAPIQTGSRAESEDLKASPFSQPLVNIVSPTALPEPSGLGSVLQAISNGNMFRDMSGLAATIGLAQAGMQATTDAATNASIQAGANLATAAKKEVEMFKAALAFAGAVMGKGSSDTSPSTISNEGAKINHGRSLDQRGMSPTPVGGSIETEGIQEGNLNYNDGGIPNQGGGLMTAGGGGGNEEAAFRRTLWGQQGQSLYDLLQPVSDKQADAGTQRDAGAGVGQTRELPPVPKPPTFAFPPVSSNIPTPPSQQPALMATCPANLFFGDPPTRIQPTRGIVLSAPEAMQRQNDVIKAIAAAKNVRPLSAASLQHWLDGTSNVLVMSNAPFKKADSEVPSFLHGTVRDEFEKGFINRLKNINHPGGTLRPATLTAGAKGPVRFLQYRDGVRPSVTATNLSQDLATALGAFNVHSAIWAQATFLRTEGGVLGIGSDDVYEVEILRWYVQIYDVYDWNAAAATPFPISTEDLAKLPLPLGAFTVRSVGAGINVVMVKDSYFRDLEVSGIGRAYLIRTESFEAPATAMSKFIIKV